MYVLHTTAKVHTSVFISIYIYVYVYLQKRLYIYIHTHVHTQMNGLYVNTCHLHVISLHADTCVCVYMPFVI